jgi:hypothetical protein
MKKLILGLAFAIVAITPILATAALVPTAETGYTRTTLTQVGVEDAVDRITNYVFVILLIVAVIFLLLAGFQFVTAGGDPDKVNSARQNVMYAMIGVTVAILAKGIVALVRGVVGGG